MDENNFDHILSLLGSRGPYQIRVFLLLCLPMSIPSVTVIFSQIFDSLMPNFWCKPENSSQNMSFSSLSLILNDSIAQSNETANLFKCNKTIMVDDSTIVWTGDPCEKWLYDTKDFDETLATKFDMTCERSWLIQFALQVFFLGNAFGTVFFGWASDRWGRKIMLLVICFFCMVLPLCSVIVPNFETHIALRFLEGLFFPAIYQVPFVLAMELVGPKDRTLAGIIFSLVFSVGMIGLALIAYLTRDWVYLTLAVALPQLSFISFIWLVPESPRWLLSKHRFDDAIQIIEIMAKYNKVTLPNNYKEKLKKTSQNVSKTDGSPLDLFIHRNIRIKFIVILYIWSASAFIYQGLTNYSAKLDVNVFAAFGASAVSEIIGCLVAWWGISTQGRKVMVCFFLILGGLACLCSFLVLGIGWLEVAFILVGRFGCTAGFIVFYLYVPELLPTVIRSQALSMSAFVSTGVLLAVPSLSTMAEGERKGLPLLIMGGLSALGGIITLVLPETLGTVLPQTIEDAEAIPPNFSCFRKKKDDYQAAPLEEPEAKA